MSQRAPLLIALLALFVALGGTSYAVSQLPKNSVGTAQLKKSAVTSTKVKNGSLLLADFKATEKSKLKGATGPAGANGQNGAGGPVGPTGEAGQDGAADPRAYARISATGSVSAGSELGISTDMIDHPLNGVYCFDLADLDFTVKTVSVTAEPTYGVPTSSDKLATAQLLTNDDFNVGCPITTDLLVVTLDISLGSAIDWYFNLALN